MDFFTETFALFSYLSLTWIAGRADMKLFYFEIKSRTLLNLVWNVNFAILTILYSPEIAAENKSLFYDGGGGISVVTSPSYPLPYPTNGNTYAYTVQNPYPRGFVQLNFLDVDLKSGSSLRVSMAVSSVHRLFIFN